MVYSVQLSLPQEPMEPMATSGLGPPPWSHTLLRDGAAAVPMVECISGSH